MCFRLIDWTVLCWALLMSYCRSNMPCLKNIHTIMILICCRVGRLKALKRMKLTTVQFSRIIFMDLYSYINTIYADKSWDKVQSRNSLGGILLSYEKEVFWSYCGLSLFSLLFFLLLHALNLSFCGHRNQSRTHLDLNIYFSSFCRSTYLVCINFLFPVNITEYCCLIHHLFYFRIPASTLSSHPLVLAALSSLNSEILSEASVNGTVDGLGCCSFFL